MKWAWLGTLALPGCRTVPEPTTPSLPAPRTASEWLARAERRIVDSGILELSVERTITRCVPPETFTQNVRATITIASGGRVAMVFRKPGGGAPATFVRCDGRDFGVARGVGPDVPQKVLRRRVPPRLAAYVAAGCVRAGLDDVSLGWAVAGYRGDEPLPDPFVVENARIVGDARIANRPAVELEYDLVWFHRRYRQRLWLDRESCSPLKRTCAEADVFPHSDILGYDETYKTQGSMVAEDVFSLPASWK